VRRDTFCGELRALRPIAGGEEITVCFEPRLRYKSGAKRRKHLRHKWLFVCRCTACAKEGRKALRSDARRAYLAQVLRDGTDGEGVRAKARDVLYCLRKEGLYGYRTGFLWGLYDRLGRRYQARAERLGNKLARALSEGALDSRGELTAHMQLFDFLEEDEEDEEDE
jgi:hypothetical protein